MLIPVCGSRCTREEASSEAEPARGSASPVGPLWWAAGAIAAWVVLCVYVSCYVLFFLQVLSRIPPVS
jgi:hypothetical protein